MLFFISYHHQTTTVRLFIVCGALLFFISYHHQTTTSELPDFRIDSCSLSHIIIKPQPSVAMQRMSYRCSLSHIIIKPQRKDVCTRDGCGCSLSHIIIKPQPISCIQLILKASEYILCIRSGMMNIKSFAKLLKKFQLNRPFLNFLFYLSPNVYNP